MVDRQRSFFASKSKVRQQWQKKSHPRIEEQYNVAVQRTMPAIAASTQTKRRLGAFRFGEEREEVAEETRSKIIEIPAQENVGAINDTRTMHNPSSSQMTPRQPLSQVSGNGVTRECPQTPAGRLPLADLVASAEDRCKQKLHLTPVERIEWERSPLESSQDSSQGSSKAPKGRKRALSSSPGSSTKKHPAKKANTRVIFDLDQLQATLKTPNGDPASELWNRYSLKTQAKGKPSADTPLAQSFSQLLESSSPPSPAAYSRLRESAGLRRSFSCGIEWPVSAAKRRKTVLQGQRVATKESSQPYDATKCRPSSRLKELVDKVHSEMIRSHRYEKPANNTPAPSSSLLEFDNADELEARAILTTNVATDTGRKGTAHKEPRTTENEISAASAARQGLKYSQQNDTSSDFGEHELDVEMMKAMENAASSLEPHGGDKYLPDEAQVKNQGGLLSSTSTLAAAALQMNDNDDFEDEVNDILAAELEEAVSGYERRIKEVDKSRKTSASRQQRDETAEGESHGVVTASMTGIGETPASDDEYGDGIDFGEGFDQDILPAAGERSMDGPLPSQVFQSPRIQRFQIVNAVDGYYQAKDKTYREKILHVVDDKAKTHKAVTLRQSWLESVCDSGAFVNIIGSFDNHGHCIIDDAQNMIILHPDYLISATVVADSFSCARRAILQDRVKVTSESSEPQIYGHILHEIFQEALRANRWDVSWMETAIHKITSRYLESFFEINLDLARAVEHLKSRANDLRAWAEVFVAAKPTALAQILDRGGAQSKMSVTKLLEVEEKVWSPMYGLKGNIDATVQVNMQNGDEVKNLTVPFELKTGKHSNAAHKAQTALYTLLLSNRYDLNIACGILYYLESAETSRVPAIRHEIIHMIKKRNELAGYIRQKNELPPVLGKSPHLCGKCYAQTPCFIYHRLVENGTGDSSGMGEKFDDLVKHLKPSHQKFFMKWDGLLTKEEKDIVKLRSELWNMQSSEREKLGRCFGDVSIDAASFDKVEEAPKINRFRYSFVKQNAPSTFSFTESQITVGEPIVISDEKGHFALASGYVTGIRKHRIDVAIDRQLHNSRAKSRRFDPQTNQSFTGIMEIVQSGSTESTIVPSQPQEQIMYRLDKDEFSNGMALIRNNLITMMQKDVFGSQSLRKLVIECVPPTFKSTNVTINLEQTSSQSDLNADQVQAIEKVMSAKDYALVLGMPGTGKTTTIAHIIRALTLQGKSILLTSYTHTAVDNILLKIRKYNIGVFRLGALAKVHPEVQEFAFLAGAPMTTSEEIKQAYSQQVVATTCLGINHSIFNQRIFDYCIVDEASQITLPVCLGPIRMARTFILVGDHYQLPPLVQNKEALQGGLDVSLFKTLSENHPDSLTYLSYQYRMCQEIMTLSNTLIYDGRLKCGTTAVATRSLQIPNIEAISKHHHTPATILSSPSKRSATRICVSPNEGSCWLRDILVPTTKACFLNTDPILPASREVLQNTRITNPFEVVLTCQLVEAMLTTGVNASDIGIITLYRSQLALLKQSLRHRPQIEMHTADKFQGRDKEVIILSMVRSNEDRNVGDLLKDWRRVNVALTRARTKLLVIGSRETLQGNDLLGKFVDLMEAKNWRYDLPRGATEMHHFEDYGTQFSDTGCVTSPRITRKAKTSPIKKTTSKVMLDASDNKENVQAIRLEQTQLKQRFKVPSKVGKKMDIKGLLEKRPVLRDIMNDAS